MLAQSVASRTFVTDRSISARLRARMSDDLAGDLVGLVEHPIGAGPHHVQTVEQLLDLEPVLGHDVVERGGQVADRRQRLPDVLAVLGQDTLQLRRSCPRRGR